MGQKVNPHGLRVGVIKDCMSGYQVLSVHLCHGLHLIHSRLSEQKFLHKKLIVDIKEVKRPDRDAQLVAENNNGMNADNLYVAACYADKGTTMKRIQPRAQGRAYRIEKRTSHITVVLDER